MQILPFLRTTRPSHTCVHVVTKLKTLFVTQSIVRQHNSPICGQSTEYLKSELPHINVTIDQSQYLCSGLFVKVNELPFRNSLAPGSRHNVFGKKIEHILFNTV